MVPTAGHTEGSTCFLWNDGQCRFLFTGDSIYLKDDEWVAAVLGVSDRTAYLESLTLIGQLDSDVIVPSMARGPAYQVTDRADTRRRITAIAERLEREETS